jgi:hypothetical protein
MKSPHISIGANGKRLDGAPPACDVCGKRTSRECSHVECANRHAVTAGPPDNAWNFPSCGAKTPAGYERGEWE